MHRCAHQLVWRVARVAARVRGGEVVEVEVIEVEKVVEVVEVVDVVDVVEVEK